MSWKNDQVSESETERILKLARRCLEIEGDFVEMGCYKGDTSLLLAEVVQNGARLRQEMRCSLSVPLSTVRSATPPSSSGIHSDPTSKKLWIYDSFEGLPEKSEFDESVMGVDFKKGELPVTKREVKTRFLRAGLPVPVIKKAWFKDLTSEDMPEKVAFSFLDGDFYESIRDSLRLVGPLMANGGIMVVHDYANPALPGVKRAVDEWVREHGPRFELVLL